MPTSWVPTCSLQGGLINHLLTTTNVTFRYSNLYTHEVYLGCVHAGMIYIAIHLDLLIKNSSDNEFFSRAVLFKLSS
jgi:hypothetical protein